VKTAIRWWTALLIIPVVLLVSLGCSTGGDHSPRSFEELLREFDSYLQRSVNAGELTPADKRLFMNLMGAREDSSSRVGYITKASNDSVSMKLYPNESDSDLKVAGSSGAFRKGARIQFADLDKSELVLVMLDPNGQIQTLTAYGIKAP
jgi:hypothetical protein